MKVFAPWCRACKGLEPKFNAIVKDAKYKDLPIIWADITIQHNKEYIKKIGVLALPTIQFYARGQRMDTFPCGPSKVPILKRKLAQLVNDNVDAETLQVKATMSETSSEGGGTALVMEVPKSGGSTAGASSSDTASTDTPVAVPAPAAPAAPAAAVDDKDKLIQRQKSRLRSVPFFAGMLESEFESVLTKANILTFESGNIIMREGNMGRTFYYIVDGEVEICQKTSFEDPLTTPPTYLGTVINRFEDGEYFGERALITGEPRAASIRASAPRTLCLAFDRDDFPATCVLSGKASGTNTNGDQDIDIMNERYGVSLYEISAMSDQQYKQALQANQIRGSVNRPREIDGVDNDIEVPEEDESLLAAGGESIDDKVVAGAGALSIGADPETIVPLLLRFKLIRLVNRCFDYIVANRLRFGDEGGQKRRMLLVNLLSIGQQAEIRDAYSLIDADGDGEITLMELQRLMASVGDVRSEEELVDFIETSHQSMSSPNATDGKQVITYRDFFGIMAEVEFYHLFLETFRALDEHDSGFVRAKDLDRVLCGIRDLVTDDRRSIIDVEDTDMMVDYEQFSKMLLGTSLT
jgi:calmodulin